MKIYWPTKKKDLEKNVIDQVEKPTQTQNPKKKVDAKPKAQKNKTKQNKTPIDFGLGLIAR